MDRFWDRAEENGHDRNPYRGAFLQLVGVADTDEQAEEQFAEHVEYFYKKLPALPAAVPRAPGLQRLQEPAQRPEVRASSSSPT